VIDNRRRGAQKQTTARSHLRKFNRLTIYRSARRTDKLSATIGAVDYQAKVSIFFTVSTFCAEGISGKWLNIRDLIAYGTALA